jgi:hypothetical protein
VRAGARALVCVFLLLMVLGGTGCGLLGTRGVAQPPPLRISDQLSEGDPVRRASIRLVIAGLDADSAGLSVRGLSNYERAIQVDPTNPYAFLALARFYADGDEPERSLALLDQAEVLLQSEGGLVPGAQVHLEGLRAQIEWKQTGTRKSERTLERAAILSPEIWGDGELSSRELR